MRSGEVGERVAEPWFDPWFMPLGPGEDERGLAATGTAVEEGFEGLIRRSQIGSLCSLVHYK